MFAALVPAFGVTGSVTQLYREHERQLAQEWRVQAEIARRAGDRDGAVHALQSALRFSPGDATYTFALARALLEAGRTVEARAYFRTLWEREPGSGPVNIELGRIGAREGDTTDAMRYYHNAIEGSWREEPETNRRLARLELARYLVRQGDFTRAHAELIPLAADLPENISTTIEVGNLLLAADAPDRARTVFESGLKRQRRNSALLAGAGEAAFQLRDYAAAAAYFARARAAGEDSESGREHAAIATEVLRGDPFQRRLRAAERARRARQAYDRSLARLDQCPPAEAFREQLDAMRPRVTLRALQRDSEIVEEVMDLSYRIVLAVGDRCGPVTPADEALLLIGRQHFEP
jgi:tetratricopeptide (TPR) repeat protein